MQVNAVAYRFSAAIFDGSISIYKFLTLPLHSFLDCLCVSKCPNVLCVIKFCLGTFTRRTVISGAHGGLCNLRAIHAQEMPETASLAHELVCKPIEIILGAYLVDFVYYGSHCCVIDGQAAL